MALLLLRAMKSSQLQPDMISFELLLKALEGRPQCSQLLKEARSSWLSGERESSLAARRWLRKRGGKEANQGLELLYKHDS